MGGGLMQLVAYGAQDIYLTGNPQITFFKVVYRRHTNFSMEAIEQTFNGTADFGKRVTCTVSRNGDLMHKVYLQVTVPRIEVKSGKSFRWLNWLGHVLIKYAEVEIGGQRIDKHYGDWMHIWNELTQTAGHKVGYANMVGNVPRLTSVTKAGSGTSDVAHVPEVDLYIPLEFWFCRNPGLALPLIALQYHEVKINIEFRGAEECYYTTDSVSPSLESASLFVDYIYLDTDERRRFAQVSHEYLIEQVQFTGDESVSSTSNKIKLNFNHPCKELVWVVQPDDHVSSTKMNTVANKGRQWFNYTDAIDASWQTGTPVDPYGGGLVNPRWSLSSIVDGSANVELDFPMNNDGTQSNTVVSLTEGDTGFNPVFTAKLQLNGHDRFSERMGRYFNLVQPYQHHTNVPAVGINVYSFGLKPEDHQPSGTCNMSRIDNATLQLTLTAAAVETGAKVRVYATNYNVLRIMSGMGGLAYSN